MKRHGGFTIVELVTAIVLLGVVAAIGLPRLMGSGGTGALVFGDQVSSALRHAHKTAVARRRLVCATLAGNAVTLRIRQQAGMPAAGAAPCTLAADPAGTGYDITGSGSGIVSGRGGFADAASIALYFHPDGTVSKDVAGMAPVARSDEIRIMEAGAVRRTIRIEGSTGHVR
ncbi:pilus assembly FimT family protein [Massilia consociata]|uniref:Tfp pilus assembly protein FimT/FimU n=1 Tax=Massilia consociata TaxID=760117 RepID=A0ABV6FJ05_9BURK